MVLVGPLIRYLYYIYATLVGSMTTLDWCWTCFVFLTLYFLCSRFNYSSTIWLCSGNIPVYGSWYVIFFPSVLSTMEFLNLFFDCFGDFSLVAADGDIVCVGVDVVCYLSFFSLFRFIWIQYFSIQNWWKLPI